MTTLKKIILVFCLFGFYAGYAQEKVYMPYFQVENVHWKYQSSATKIFRTYVNNNNVYNIILPEKADSAYAKESFEQTVQNAKAIGAKYYIIGEMNALNEVLIINISMFNTDDGKKVWSDILKAKTPDDLDPILSRVANNLGTPQKASVDGDIYSVTNYDSQQLKKIDASYNYGFSLNGAGLLVSKVNNAFPAGFGFLASYDTRNIIIDIQGDLLFGDIDMYYAKINALYPFKPSKNSMFVGGSLGWGGISAKVKTSQYSNYESGSGMTLFANGGYIFNRNANVNLRLTGSLFAPFYKVNGDVPFGAMFSVAVLF